MNSNPVRARILVSGSVQGVGYRHRVATIARRLGIRGVVRNLEDGQVEIFCEADNKKQFDDFIFEIKQPHFLIVVENIVVYFEGQDGYYSHPHQPSEFGIEY